MLPWRMPVGANVAWERDCRDTGDAPIEEVRICVVEL